MGKRTFLLFVFLILVNLASADVIFSGNFSDIYSIGDLIPVNFSVVPNISSSAYLEAYLVCNDSENLIFKQFQIINKLQEKHFNFDVLASHPGKCRIKALFPPMTGYSDEFKISNKLIISYELNDHTFYPLDILRINGTVQKENGKNITGVITVLMDDIVNKSVGISNGKFSSEIKLPANALPKKYVLKLIAKSNGNYGIEEQEIIVKPKPSFIEISSDESFKPSGNLTIKTRLLDQAKNFLENYSVLIKIFDPYKNIYLQKTVVSGNNLSVYFPDNSTKGRWDINAYYGSVFATKPLYITENLKLKTEIVEKGGFLKVKNIGNIRYEGIIKVNVEEFNKSKTIPLNINLSVGELKNYPLDLEENRVYNLSVGNKSFENVAILGTGAAVSQKFDSINLSSYFVIFSLFLAALVFFIAYKKRYFGFFGKSRLFKKEKTFKHSSLDSKRRVYICFIDSPEIETIKEIAKKYNYSLEEISCNLSFVLFYSSDEFEKTNILYFVKELKNKIPNITAVLHSEFFEGKISSLKTSFLTKEIAKKVEGVYATEDFCNLFLRLRKGKTRVFKVKEKYIKVFELVI